MVDEPRSTHLSLGALAAASGGTLLVVSLFLDWFFGLTAFQAFHVMDVVLALIGLAAVGLALLEATGSAVRLPFERVAALRLLGVVATALVAEVAFEGTDQRVGTFLGLAGALAILAGGLLARRRPVPAVASRSGGSRGPGSDARLGPPPAPPRRAGDAATPGGDPASAASDAPPSADAPSPRADVPPPPADASPRSGDAAPPSDRMPDWYPDPRGESRLRYWDGTGWTHHAAD